MQTNQARQPAGCSRFSGVWLALLCAAMAWQLATVPRRGLILFPASALAWLAVLVCCAVLAEAQWNDRRWRLKAGLVVGGSGLLLAAAWPVDMIWTGPMGPAMLMPGWIGVPVYLTIPAMFVYELSVDGARNPVKRRTGGPGTAP